MNRISLIALLALTACGSKSAPTPAVAETNPYANVGQSIQETLNPEVSPCDDFYEYACGGWLAKTTIPETEARWSRGFSVVYERNEENIRLLIKEAAEAESPTPVQAMVGDYYNACMDTETIDANGLEPLREPLEWIDAIESLADVFRVSGQLQPYDMTPIFGLWVGQDYKNPDNVLMNLSQGGLGLPEKNFYVGDRAKPELLESYTQHVQKMLEMTGLDTAAAENEAKAIVAFETKLAEQAKERAELRDANKTYHPMNREGLQALNETLPWDAFFESIGRPEMDQFNVYTPGFFEALGGILEDTSIPTLQAYLRWHLAHGMANRLGQGFVDENFAFYGTALSGTKQQNERWKRCVRATSSYLGEEVGQLYVAKHFAGDSKEVALDMITRIEKSFEEALPELEWMDEVTRERAVGKARAIKNKIGYPDKWRELDGVTISADDYFGSTMSVNRYKFDYYLDKVGNPPDPDEWFMPPQVVNAYYNPAQNEIAFPAGILQDPFFSATNPRAMNFGSMGMVMGHEISHGFDDSGRRFSATGVLEEWWEPEVAARFEERAECIVEQYAGYEPLEGKPLNGRLTLGENIADNGGMKQSYYAYMKWLEDNGREPEVAGFTNEQLFFIGSAQSWCSLVTDELQEQYLVTDPHSPAKFRMNGSVVNFPAFAEAFECPVGSPMNPESRCEVW